MRFYTTLSNIKYDLNNLTKEHKKFLEKIVYYYKENPQWNKFTGYWLREGQKVWGSIKNRREVTKLPIFRICQDIGSRLGIKQGYTRPTDYRDLLEELIDSRYPSRYKFCKENGIREDLISRVLNKRRDISIEALQKILKALHYEIYFREVPTSEKVKEPFVSV